MKRKIIPILGALVLVVSGVAAVSAYEAHLINVTAHVENALSVNTTAIDFGTVFPQEVLKVHRNIALSESALAEGPAGTTPLPGDLMSVDYQVWAECKPNPNIPGDFYQWLGEWLWVGIDASQDPTLITGHVRVGAAPTDPCPAAKPILDAAGNTLTGTLSGNNTVDMMGVTILTPAFVGYYNELTDQKPDWFQAVIDAGNWPLLDGDPDGTDLGLDLKIQVTGINRFQNP